MRNHLKKTWRTLVGVSLLSGVMATAVHAEEETVKIGVLHSLSGTMAISETSLRDVVLMAVEEINAAGGVLGKKIEPVVVDPASDWPLFAEKAKELIVDHDVAATFGCWTSVSRKSCLPVFLGNRSCQHGAYRTVRIGDGVFQGNFFSVFYGIPGGGQYGHILHMGNVVLLFHDMVYGSSVVHPV